jgi:hypothetical protein
MKIAELSPQPRKYEQAAELARQGLRLKEIAAAIGSSYSSASGLLCYAKQLGLPITPGVQSKIDTILALRAEGLKYREIAARLGMPVGSVAGAVWKHKNREGAREHNRACEKRRYRGEVLAIQTEADIDAWWKARGF